MRHHKQAMMLLLIFVLVLSACGSSDDGDGSPATARPEQRNAAQTALAAPTNTPSDPPTATPVPDIESELARTVANMANAVLDQDEETYFDQLYQEDEIFLREQQSWSEFWLGEDLEEFTMRLTQVEVVSEVEAKARLTVAWSRSEVSQGQSGGATYTVRFYKEAPDSSKWLYAGEAWHTVSMYWDGTSWTAVWEDETPPANSDERVRVYYFPDYGPIEGTRDATERLLEDVPGIYNVVISEFDYEPTDPIHIKLYDMSANIKATTGLTLPATIPYWNVPGQSMKITQRENTELPPFIEDQVRYATESVLLQIADDTNPYPAWVMSGLQTFVIGENYETVTFTNNNIEAVIGQLPNTEEINPSDSPLLTDFPTSTSGHIFFVFLTEAFGKDQRNAFINALAEGMTPEEASQMIFEKSFEDLNGDWLLWLAEKI